MANHPIPNYDLVAHGLAEQDADYRGFETHHDNPSPLMVRDGALNPVQDRRSDRVPEPVQIRTPAVIHYPRARDVIVVNSGVDINEQKIGFDCRSIVIQNVGGNSFLYCPELNIYLSASATPMATFNLPSSVSKLSFRWHTAAFNPATPAPAPGEFAMVWLFDEWILPMETAAGGGGGGGSTGTASTAVQSRTAQSAVSQNVLLANPSRKGASFYNDSAANVYLSYDVVASATNFKVKLAAGAYYEIEPQAVYTGDVTAIWDAAGAGAIQVTELS